jgi:hypothetical protein
MFSNLFDLHVKLEVGGSGFFLLVLLALIGVLCLAWWLKPQPPTPVPRGSTLAPLPQTASAAVITSPPDVCVGKRQSEQETATASEIVKRY